LLLTKSKINSNRGAIDTVYESHKRANKIVNICLFARSLFEIYDGYEPNLSDLIPDRITYYKKRIETDLEILREVHNILQKSGHPYSSVHTDLLNNPKNLAIWDMTDSMNSQGEQRVSSNISFNIGVTNFIARSTDISGLKSEILAKGINSPNLTQSTKDSIQKLEFYVMYNGMNGLREIAELSAKYFLEESISDFEGNQKILYIVSCLGTGCVVLIVVFFVPYIMKVQRNILKVFDHMSDIRQEEIRKILDMCYIFKDEIEAPIAKLKAIYDKEDFAMTTDELRKEEKTKKEELEKKKRRQGILKKMTQKEVDNTRDNIDDDDEDKKEEKSPLKNKKDEKSEQDAEKEQKQDAEKQYLLLTEERRTKAKKKLFSQITSSKRKGYIFRLAVFLIFFAIFLIVDVFLLKSFFEKSVDAFNIMGLFSRRSYMLRTAILFYREDLVVKDKLRSSGIFIRKYK